MYLTLEPCSHYGQTPPCTKAIIKYKIKKVNYSIEDIDTRCFNKAKKILNSKKIKTKSGLLGKEVKNLYNSYIYTKKNNFIERIDAENAQLEKGFWVLKNVIINKPNKKVAKIDEYTQKCG